MEYDELYKIILVGDSGVGKTNLLFQYVKEEQGGYFDPSSRPTIGVEFGTKTVIHPNGARIKAQIWDTAGQERYRSIASSHYKRAAGALLVYDVSNPKTLESVKTYWSKEVRKASEPGSTLADCLMLVGNKIDLASRVSEKQHNSAVSSMKLSYSGLTSAKTAQNVHQVFEDLVIAIYDQDKEKGGEKPKGINLDQPTQKSGCC
mmetsp:Transcript_4480/g.5811  ORF Transcript_4480/g.5811 Transcript_4480/m.5811 type:complete len:204 (-) Transcript_4480:446-1057(-)